MRVRWLLSLAVLAFVGCMTGGYTPPAPSPLASPESDEQGKQFVPPEGRGNVYVQRVNELILFGQPTPFGVTLDGKEVGGIVPGMYYCFSLEPGTHTLSATSEVSIAHETVHVEPGKNYFYQITTSKAADNSVRLILSYVILEPLGKLMVQQSKRGQAAIQ